MVRIGDVVAWVKLDDRITDHKRYGALSERGLGALVRCLAWCNRNETDGFLPARILSTLISAAGRRELEACRLPEDGQDERGAFLPDYRVAIAVPLVASGAGVWIRDYLDYQPSRAKLEAERDKARARMGRARKGAEPDANGAGSSADVRANDAGTSPEVRMLPVPDPDPPVAIAPGGDARETRGSHGSSLRWHRTHGPDRHVPGFCGFKCFPVVLRNEFARDIASDPAEIDEWAAGIRDTWQGAIVEPDCFKFWRELFRADARRGFRPGGPAPVVADVEPYVAGSQMPGAKTHYELREAAARAAAGGRS
jgi:hypothetical protein